MATTSAEKRNSGIPVVESLRWGSHLCQFYNTPEDFLDVVVPYFRAGLESNELCFWITPDFLTPDDALKALARGVPNFSKYETKKQIEVLPHSAWYLEGEELFRALDGIKVMPRQAIARGFAGLRASGTPFWLDNKKAWDNLTAYEANATQVMNGIKIVGLCTYSLRKCVVAEILDVVKNHHYALAKNRGAWQLVHRPAQAKRTGRRSGRGVAIS